MFGNLDELDNWSFWISVSFVVYYNFDIERGIYINQFNEYIYILEVNLEKYQIQFDVSSFGICIMYLGYINEVNLVCIYFIFLEDMFLCCCI